MQRLVMVTEWLKATGRSLATYLSIALLLTVRAAVAAPVRMEVKASGMYRVTGAEFAQAGVQLGELTADRVGLSCGGKPLACRIIGAADGKLTPTTEIIFPGEGLDTPFTDSNVYWLTWGDGAAARMSSLSLSGQGGATRGWLTAKAHLEENHEYVHLVWAAEREAIYPWFWKTVTAGTKGSVEFALPDPVAGDGQAKVRVILRGRSANPTVTPDHHVLVNLNGQQIGDTQFDGQTTQVIEGTVGSSLLKPEGNQLTLTLPGDTKAGEKDRVCLDWVEVEYPRGLVCHEGRLSVDIPEGMGATLRVSGLREGPADVYEIAAPDKVSVAAGVPVKAGTVELGLAPGPARRLEVVGDGEYRTADAIAVGRDPELKAQGNGADYVIIADGSLLEAVKPLAEYRASRGLKVRSVDVGQVYDEFSYGVFTPQGIRDFLAYAWANWQPRPQYVLLVGDATYDYRDYLGTGFRNLVPSVTVRECGGVEVAADRAYVVDEQGKQTMAVGRWPVQTPEETAALAQRTIEYERNGAGEPKTVVFAADQEGFGGARMTFSVDCDRLAEAPAAAGFKVEKMYQTDVGLKEEESVDERVRRTKEALTRKIVEVLGRAPLAMLYFGHGDEYYWGYDKLLAVDDLAGVSFDRPGGVVVEDTCFAGAFDCPGGDEGLSEALLRSGACVACYAPTRLGGADVQLELLKAIVAGDARPIGTLALELRGGQPLRLQDGSWASGANFNLLGDPALGLKRATP
jgi:hypothetical protein